MSWRHVVTDEVDLKQNSFGFIGTLRARFSSYSLWLLQLKRHIFIWSYHPCRLFWFRGLELVNHRHHVFVRRSVKLEVEVRISVLWVAYSNEEDSLWNSFQSVNVSHIQVCLSRRSVEGELEYTSIEIIVSVKQIQNCPPERHEFLMISCVRLGNLELND